MLSLYYIFNPKYSNLSERTMILLMESWNLPACSTVFCLFCLSAVIAALSVINEVVEKGDAAVTKRSLQVDEAKFTAVEDANAELYQDVLYASKRAKAQVDM